MHEPRNRAIKKSVQQKDRIRLPLDVSIFGPHSPEWNKSLVGCFKFIIVDGEPLISNELVYVRIGRTDGQEHVLMRGLVGTDHSFWISMENSLNHMLGKIVSIFEANEDMELQPEEYHANAADDVEIAHISALFPYLYNIITASY